MIWRAKQVEAIVAVQEASSAGPSVSVSMGKRIGFKTLFLIPSAMEARKNPDGATRSIIPADLYSRWLALRTNISVIIKDEESDIGEDAGVPMFAAMGCTPKKH
jgi:uncharacterized caspase-like protein